VFFVAAGTVERFTDAGGLFNGLFNGLFKSGSTS
jgi:hypothetical protein